MVLNELNYRQILEVIPVTNQTTSVTSFVYISRLPLYTRISDSHTRYKCMKSHPPRGQESIFQQLGNRTTCHAFFGQVNWCDTCVGLPRYSSVTVSHTDTSGRFICPLRHVRSTHVDVVYHFKITG